MTTETESTARLVEAMRAEMTATRRQLHRQPELGFQEVNTAALVAARLRALDGC